MSSKGLELPINVIVIVAIAVLVLVVAAALFSQQFGAGVGTITLEQAYSKGCQTLRAVHNCNADRVDQIKTDYVRPGGDPTKAEDKWNLLQVCQQKFTGTTVTEAICARNCGCPS